MSAEALSSFEAKWAFAHPELALALRYARRSERPLIGALACLSYEIGHAAFQIAEREVATTKLHWWARELSGLEAGEVQHPLCAILLHCGPLRELAAGNWTALIAGAFLQRDASPAPNMSELLGTYRAFHSPLAVIEAALHPNLDVHASTCAAILSRAVQETLRLPEALAADRLPVPLDLLARHQLSRGELGQPGAPRAALLREHFATLETALREIGEGGLSPLSALSLHADRKRSRRAAHASDPLAGGDRELAALPWSSAWVGWRAARRMQTTA